MYLYYMTTLVNVKKVNLQEKGYVDFKDWASKDNHVYIGRNMSFYVESAVASKWANPYPAKKFGLEKCLEMYENNLVANKKLMDELSELKGKEVGMLVLSK